MKARKLEERRKVIDDWLRVNQPRGSRVSMVGTKMAKDLLKTLKKLSDKEQR